MVNENLGKDFFEKHTGLNKATFIIIFFGIIIFIALLVTARWFSIRQKENARVKDQPRGTEITERNLKSDNESNYGTKEPADGAQKEAEKSSGALIKPED